MSGPTVKTFVDAVAPLVTLFRYGQVPSGQAMPYADYLPKLTTTDSADDRAMHRRLRYDLRIYQPMDGQDDALIASILDALDAADITADAYSYAEDDEKDIYTVIEMTI